MHELGFQQGETWKQLGLAVEFLSLFAFWFKAAFKALLGVLGSCLLVFAWGVVWSGAAEAGMKSFAVRFERLFMRLELGFRLGTDYVCSGPGVRYWGHWLGLWTWDVGVLCALHYTIDARNNLGWLGWFVELVDYGGQWNFVTASKYGSPLIRVECY